MEDWTVYLGIALLASRVLRIQKSTFDFVVVASVAVVFLVAGAAGLAQEIF